MICLGIGELALNWDAPSVRLSTVENICAAGSQSGLGRGCFPPFPWDFRDCGKKHKPLSVAQGFGLCLGPSTGQFLPCECQR